MTDGRGLQKGNTALSIEQDIDLEALGKDFVLDRLVSTSGLRACDLARLSVA